MAVKTLYSAIFLLIAGFAWAESSSSLEADEAPYWEDLKTIVFEDRLMLDGGEYIDADIPTRTENDLRQVLGARVISPDYTPIKKVYLVIDENPTPVSLTLTPSKAVSALNFGATFRVNRPTNSHVVLELADGRLFVEENYIKTSGIGACSSPPISDPENAKDTMGDITLFYQRTGASALLNGGTDDVEIQISHPQNSGMQKNQVTLLYIPARFVTNLDLKVNGKEWMTLEGSISLSENPDIHVSLPENAENVSVTLRDSDGLEKRTTLEVN